MLFSGIIAALTSLLIPIIILLLLLPNACYVVEQQHAVIIERLGRFNRIVNAGFHVKVPVIDRKAATVSLRTMKNGFGIDVKTQDNVTIGLEVSAQYHVSYDMGAGPADSGIYKSYYMLQEPVDQMRDFITRLFSRSARRSSKFSSFSLMRVLASSMRSLPRRMTSPRMSTLPFPSRWPPTASPSCRRSSPKSHCRPRLRTP